MINGADSRPKSSRRPGQLAVRRIHATFAPKERTQDESMDDEPQNVPVQPDLAASIRQARVENAERADAIAEVRELEIIRLKALESALERVIDQAPQGVDLFDMALTQSEHPRLFLDMVAFIDLAHDKRTYRFFQDTRNGRVLMAESQSADTIVAAVADYVARRLVERERAVTVDSRVAEARRPQPAEANGPATWPIARPRMRALHVPSCRRERASCRRRTAESATQAWDHAAARRCAEPVSHASGLDHARASARDRRLLGLDHASQRPLGSLDRAAAVLGGHLQEPSEARVAREQERARCGALR